MDTQVDRAIVTLAGDLDIASAGALGEGLAALVGQGSTRIVVDVSGLVFCDACGLGILVKAAVRALHRGGWLRIAAPGPLIDRIIEITRLTRMLPMYGTVEDALADRAGAPRGAVGG